MEIKLVEFLNFMSKCNSIPELKIKSDLMYGETFDVILDKFLEKLGYKIDPYTLAYMTLRDLKFFLEMIGRNFELQNRQYVHKEYNYNQDYYTRFTEEYYLPERYSFENISINI